MSILELATSTAILMFTYAEINNIELPNTNTANVTVIAINDIANVNYASYLLNLPESKSIKSCKDVIKLIDELKIPNLSIINNDLEIPKKNQLSCIVKVGESTSNISVYKT